MTKLLVVSINLDIIDGDAKPCVQILREFADRLEEIRAGKDLRTTRIPLMAEGAASDGAVLMRMHVLDDPDFNLERSMDKEDVRKIVAKEIKVPIDSPLGKTFGGDSP